MKRKLLLLPLALLSTVALTSCSGFFEIFGNKNSSDNSLEVNDSTEIESSEEDVSIENDAPVTLRPMMFDLEDLTGYSLFSNTKVNIYFKNSGSVPYVDVRNFFHTIDGLVKFNHLTFEKDTSKQQLHMTYRGVNKFIFDAKRDEITIENYENIEDMIGRRSDKFTPLKYAKGEKSTLVNYSSTDNHPVVLNLRKYNIDIMTDGNNAYYVPFAVLNQAVFAPTLFNFYYSPEGVALLGNEGDPEDPAFAKLIRSNGETRPKDLVDFNYNYLCWLFDEFYGLKKDRNITSFKSYFETYYPGLKSASDSSYNSALKRFIAGLDDGHTSYSYNSPYIDSYENYRTKYNDYGDHYNDICDAFDYLEKQYSRSGKANVHKNTPVRYYDDTAIIDFPEFDGIDEYDAFDGRGNLDPNAWKYDCYWRFVKAMEDIKTHSSVRYILVDNARNGGGYVYQLINLLGFLTNDTVKFSYHNQLSNKYVIEEYQVDSDADGSFSDDDAYTQYKWTISTSVASFSAGNAFPCMSQSLGQAKIIGQTSGGGQCSVLPCILPDGSAICISNASYTMKKITDYTPEEGYSLAPVELGCTPDVPLELNQLFDDAALVNAVHRAHQN